MKPLLFLPVPLALASGFFSGAWLDSLVFSLLYLGTVRLAEKWGSDGWILLFCGGEPLVLVTAGQSWEAAVLLQGLVLWAAIVSAPDRSGSWGGWPLLVGVAFVLSGGVVIAALGEVFPALLIVGGLLLSAFFLVWLAEHQMRSGLEIGR